jgi:hypothetical protein
MKLDSRNRYIVHINPQGAGYTQTQSEVLYRTMEERFHAVLGVIKVGIANYTPMEDNNWGNGVAVQGEPDPNKIASYIKANGECLDSEGTPVLMGRGIGVQDTSTAPAVVVVNRAFVKEFFMNKSPIGRRIGPPESPGDFEVVGVAEDTVYSSVRWKDHSMYFLPIMRGAAMQTGFGLAIGIPVALLSVRFVKAQLYEITSANTQVMLRAIVTLAVSVCIASLIPAHRAPSIEPVQALRME